MSTAISVMVQPTFEDALWKAKRMARMPAVRQRSISNVMTWGVLVVLAIFTPPYLSGQLVTGAYYGVAAAVVGYLIWSDYRTRNPRMTDIEKQSREVGVGNYLQGYLLSISPNGIEWSNEMSSGGVGWLHIEAIEHDPERIVFQLSRFNELLLVPRRAFSNQDAYDNFVSAAVEWRASQPGPELECPECHYDLRGAAVAGCPECGWRRENVKADGTVN